MGKIKYSIQCYIQTRALTYNENIVCHWSCCCLPNYLKTWIRTQVEKPNCSLVTKKAQLNTISPPFRESFIYLRGMQLVPVADLLAEDWMPRRKESKHPILQKVNWDNAAHFKGQQHYVMVELQNAQIAYHPASIPDTDLIIRGVFSAPLGKSRK